jgi:4-hydroxy-tetrahydrodipicolinate synthase
MARTKIDQLDLVRNTPLFAAIPTFFQDRGKTPQPHPTLLDIDSFREQLNRMLANGVAPLIIGTTGESPTTSTLAGEEGILTIVAKTRMEGHPTIPLVVGTGSNNTYEAVKYTQAAFSHGVNGALSVVPYYNKPSQEGLSQHFGCVAEAAEGNPVIVYNIPGRTGGNGILPKTIQELADKYPNIAGVKECNPAQMTPDVIRSYPDGFKVWSGNDDTLVNNMEDGACGGISVWANADPECVKEVMRLVSEQEIEKARALAATRERFISLLFGEGNPTGIKAALKLQGIGNGQCRLPMVEASERLYEELTDEMRKLHITSID